MAKEVKSKKPRAKKYDEQLAAKPGSFLDIMQASVKDAEREAAEKKKAE